MDLTVDKMVKIMNEMAPTTLAEDWDNVGLMLGRRDQKVKVIMCALDLSPEVLEQAVRKKCDLVITHHPAIFKGMKSITDSDWKASMLLEAARHDMAIYSAHTNLDSVAGGVSDVLADLLGLENVEPLAGEDGSLSGTGRSGRLKKEMELDEFADKVKKVLKLRTVTVVSAGRPVKKVAVCGGSGMDFLEDVKRSGADTYVTGDVKYHQAQDAAAAGINLIDATHQGTELPIVNKMADRLALRLSKEGYAIKVLVAKEKLLLQPR